MEDTTDLLLAFRNLLIKKDCVVSEIEMTSNNHDMEGILIEGEIPTFTTTLCEVGAYRETLYFNYIFESVTVTKTFFDVLQKYSNLFIFSLRDFQTILYPRENFSYGSFERSLEKEKYVQVELNFSLKDISVDELYGIYEQVGEHIQKNTVKVVDQLAEDIRIKV